MGAIEEVGVWIMEVRGDPLSLDNLVLHLGGFQCQQWYPPLPLLAQAGPSPVTPSEVGVSPGVNLPSLSYYPDSCAARPWLLTLHSLLCCQDPPQATPGLPGKSAMKTTSVWLSREPSISCSWARQGDRSTSSGCSQGVGRKGDHSALTMSTRGSKRLAGPGGGGVSEDLNPQPLPFAPHPLLTAAGNGH